jgi:hypothetical protein
LIHDNGFGDSAAMPSKLITGTALDFDEPEWAPLERVLWSDELCAHFMWMFAVLLEGGTLLNAYKHRWTRGYLHLGADGTAYRYMGDRGYTSVALRELLEEVFYSRGCWRPTPSERAAIAAALGRAQR